MRTLNINNKGTPKLTPMTVGHIKTNYKAFIMELAKEHNVKSESIHNIIIGRTWTAIK